MRSNEQRSAVTPSGSSQTSSQTEHRESREPPGWVTRSDKANPSKPFWFPGPASESRVSSAANIAWSWLVLKSPPITMPLVVGVVVRITSWTFSHCVCGPFSKVPFQSISLYLQNRLILRRIGIILIELNVLCTQEDTRR